MEPRCQSVGCLLVDLTCFFARVPVLLCRNEVVAGGSKSMAAAGPRCVRHPGEEPTSQPWLRAPPWKEEEERIR